MDAEVLTCVAHSSIANNISQLNRCENKKLPKQKTGKVELLCTDCIYRRARENPVSFGWHGEGAWRSYFRFNSFSELNLYKGICFINRGIYGLKLLDLFQRERKTTLEMDVPESTPPWPTAFGPKIPKVDGKLRKTEKLDMDSALDCLRRELVSTFWLIFPVMSCHALEQSKYSFKVFVF